LKLKLIENRRHHQYVEKYLKIAKIRTLNAKIKKIMTKAYSTLAQ